jgi:hypothetical protein
VLFLFKKVVLWIQSNGDEDGDDNNEQALRAQRLEAEAAALALEKQRLLLDTSAAQEAARLASAERQHWEATANTLTHQLAQARVDLLVGCYCCS